MSKHDYPPCRSNVLVKRKSGDEEHYVIDASPGIANHLAYEARNTGALVLRNPTESYIIPWEDVESIRIVLDETDGETVDPETGEVMSCAS